MGASGNPAVVAAVESADGTIGYAESANLKAAASTVPHVKYATVGGKDPYADFPASLAVLVSSDRVLSGVNATTGRPVTAALTPFGQTGCMLLVDPAGYANITSRYPIMAVSYLIANNKGNTSTDVGAVRGPRRFGVCRPHHGRRDHHRREHGLCVPVVDRVDPGQGRFLRQHLISTSGFSWMKRGRGLRTLPFSMGYFERTERSPALAPPAARFTNQG